MLARQLPACAVLRVAQTAISPGALAEHHFGCHRARARRRVSAFRAARATSTSCVVAPRRSRAAGDAAGRPAARAARRARPRPTRSWRWTTTGRRGARRRRGRPVLARRGGAQGAARLVDAAGAPIGPSRGAGRRRRRHRATRQRFFAATCAPAGWTVARDAAVSRSPSRITAADRRADRRARRATPARAADRDDREGRRAAAAVPAVRRCRWPACR